MESQSKPIIVIVGPTASGKSDLSLRLAEQYKGEIIAADSRTVYKGMDIGTAKPSLQEQQHVTHHGLDLITPDRSYSAAEYKDYANQVIHTIHKRIRLPIVVGGTGLYVDGLVYDFKFAPPVDPALRTKLESLNIDELQKLATEKGIDPEQVSYANPRHLSRAIERGLVAPAPELRKKLPPNVLLLGVQIDKEQLHERIEARVDKMFTDGFVAEVQNLIDSYGQEAPGLLAPGYKEVNEYLRADLTLGQTREQLISSHRNLAKRQMTWFRRNQDIHWITSREEAEQLISDFLLKFDTMDS
jgi:tRNA dimethylallyltransferase